MKCKMLLLLGVIFCFSNEPGLCETLNYHGTFSASYIGPPPYYINNISDKIIPTTAGNISYAFVCLGLASADWFNASDSEVYFYYEDNSGNKVPKKLYSHLTDTTGVASCNDGGWLIPEIYGKPIAGKYYLSVKDKVYTGPYVKGCGKLDNPIYCTTNTVELTAGWYLVIGYPQNGACSIATNGQTFTSAPSTNLCAAGSASAVTTLTSGDWSWTCGDGQYGGSIASCGAYLKSACGSSNGQTFTTAPSTGLCLAGTASGVSGSGPWSWTCNGTNPGNTANCSANIQHEVLTVYKTGTSSGSVTVNTDTISWSGAIGTATYNYGTQVILTATPDPGKIFTGWSGCDSVNAKTCTVTMNAPRSVTANFVPDITPIINLLLED